MSFNIEKSINDANQLYDYLNQDKSSNNPTYLKILDNHLIFTNDKTEKASKKQLQQFAKTLLAQVSEDRTINGPTPRKTHLQDQLAKVFECLFKGPAKIVECSISIKKDNPFYKTDLLVLPDDYKGVFPLNGISESDFNEMTQVVVDLNNTGKAGSLSIKVEGNEGREFQEKVVSAIIQLSRRRIGRDILRALINQPTPIHISHPHTSYNAEIKNSPALFDDRTKTIYLNPDKVCEVPVYTGMENQKNQWSFLPSFMTLGHEMIHVIAFLSEKTQFVTRMETPTTNKSLSNLEEHKTILGWKVEDHASSPLDSDIAKRMEEEEDWDKILQENISVEKHFQWQEQSENGLRAAFGFSPRVSHEARDINDPIKHYQNILYTSQSIQELNRVFTKELIQYLDEKCGWKSLVLNTAMVAFQKGEIKTFNLLKKMLFPVFHNWINLKLVEAIFERNQDKINFLIAIGADGNLRNDSQLIVKFEEIFLNDLKDSSGIKDLQAILPIFLHITQSYNRQDFLESAMNLLIKGKKWTPISNLISYPGIGIKKDWVEKLLPKWQETLNKELLFSASDKHILNTQIIINLGADTNELFNCSEEKIKALGLNQSNLHVIRAIFDGTAEDYYKEFLSSPHSEKELNETFTKESVGWIKKRYNWEQLLTEAAEKASSQAQWEYFNSLSKREASPNIDENWINLNYLLCFVAKDEITKHFINWGADRHLSKLSEGDLISKTKELFLSEIQNFPNPTFLEKNLQLLQEKIKEEEWNQFLEKSVNILIKNNRKDLLPPLEARINIEGLKA